LRSFLQYQTDNSVELYIYGSKDQKDFRSLLLEYVKLFIYDRFAFS